jgi:hypothetical protein
MPETQESPTFADTYPKMLYWRVSLDMDGNERGRMDRSDTPVLRAGGNRDGAIRRVARAAFDAPQSAFWRIDIGPLTATVPRGGGERWTLRCAALSRVGPAVPVR